MSEVRHMHDQSSSFKRDSELMFRKIEKTLLRKLDESGWEDKESLYQLLYLYEKTGMLDRVQLILDRMDVTLADSEVRADVLLKYGQLMEQRKNYQAAEAYYRAALRLDPHIPGLRYFIHNNLGFCLNMLGRYSEAIAYLEEAIRIGPLRSNAYKNLGLSFVGMGMNGQAAEQFMAATRIYAGDGRSLRHLEELLKDHPELYKSIPGMARRLDDCRKAVAAAIAGRPQVH